MIGLILPGLPLPVRLFEEAGQLTPAQRGNLVTSLILLTERAPRAFPYGSMIFGMYHRRGLLRRRRLEAVKVRGAHERQPLIYVELYELDDGPLDPDDPRILADTWSYCQ